jgi:hypothetical protein
VSGAEAASCAGAAVKTMQVQAIGGSTGYSDWSAPSSARTDRRRTSQQNNKQIK